MIEILKKMFEEHPEKSTITWNGECVDCGCDVTIDILPTSRGYGLNGGALLRLSTDEFCAKCPDCYKDNHVIDNQNGAHGE